MSEYIGAISGVLSGLNYMFKLYQAGEAVYDTRQTLSNDQLSTTQKTFRVGTNMIFATTQSRALVMGISGASPESILKAKTLAGFCDVTRISARVACKSEPVNYDDVLKVVTIALVRLGDLGETAIETRPELFRGYEDIIRMSSRTCEPTAYLIAHRHTIYAAIQNFRQRNNGSVTFFL